MRLFNIFLVIGIMASAWAAYEYLGGLAEDDIGRTQRVFAEQVDALEPEAVAGNIVIQYKLARLYATADTLVADPALAAQWMERAALQGHVRAQYYFADMLEHGTGTALNLKDAVLWYQRAARNGSDVDAQYALGRLYVTGVGVGYDTTQATTWYRRAAHGGHPAAQYMVGRMFETGWDVKEDIIEAYMWYLLANEQRDKAIAGNAKNDPRVALQRLEPQMNNSQREMAVRLAKNWSNRQ